ncbi:hypothetical protein [Arcanobacterium bovis]|uniref:Uncharacterized protein n=1 Tax=Arcanobacterium bovis TaxID=2529275 RepID=A0A4V2KQY6_9ACTO|nr:hypothetical protein [Arcanobacterium bovis]TBW20773.1 hypothetical protein EZJ44_08290 [Arcanobacterium bovis]
MTNTLSYFRDSPDISQVQLASGLGFNLQKTDSNPRSNPAWRRMSIKPTVKTIVLNSPNLICHSSADILLTLWKPLLIARPDMPASLASPDVTAEPAPSLHPQNRGDIAAIISAVVEHRRKNETKADKK